MNQARSTRRLFVYALVVADAALVGGLATLLLVDALLVQIMHRLVSGAAQGEILNVLDHLLPYYLAFGSSALIVTVLTSFVLGFKTHSWRVAALPIAGLAAAALVFLLR